MQTNSFIRKTAAGCILLMLLSVPLTGCGQKGEDARDFALLKESMDLLEAAGAYSYKIETAIQGADSFEQISVIRVIEEPFVSFTESTSKSDGKADFIAQAYTRENSDRSLDLFLRSTGNEEGDFSEWNPSHMSQETADIQLPMMKDGMKRNIDLMRANLALFKRVEREQEGEKSAIVFKGAITPDSAAQLYNDSLRDYYREIGMVEDKDLTVEAAKKEIETSDLTELKSGIPGLALSPDPIPVKIWIDEKSRLPVKLELDVTEIIQARSGAERIEKAITTYSLIESGEQVTIPTPDGIK